MKLVSPAQRGTTWRCTWSTIPAPATRPRFQPRLKPAGAYDRPQGLDPLQRETMNLECGLVAEVAELAEMLVRSDEEMPRRVRELVQEDERALAAADDERVLDFAGCFGAEEAPRLLVGMGDVFETPGRPQLLRHRFDLLNFGACRPTTWT